MTKKTIKKILRMAIPWAIYLTATMLFFERMNITPETVPGGVIGWAVIVELPRVLLGFWLIKQVMGRLK